MDIYNALKLIASRSTDMSIVQESLKAMRAPSRAQQRRYSWLLPQALASGEFSAAERAEMIALLELTDSELRKTWIQIRATDKERVELDRRAREAGMNRSDYIRKELGIGQRGNI